MRIKELREQMGLTLTQVADGMDVTVAAVIKWEAGRACPKADKLPALADLLHCSIDALYGRGPSTQCARDAS